MKKIFTFVFIISLLLPALVFAQFSGSSGPFPGAGSGGGSGDFLADGSVPMTGALETSNGSILSNASASGVLTLGGTGGSNNENITLDFETTSNRAKISSSTSLTNLFMADDFYFGFGDTLNSRVAWETQGNDHLQLGIGVGAATNSGYFSLVESGDLGHANRSPSGTTANPTFRVYSADEAVAADYLEFYHNQSDSIIESGAGGVNIITSSVVRLYPDYRGGLIVYDGITEMWGWYSNIALEQSILGVSDSAGNQLVLSNSTSKDKDHDHAPPTNPTLYVHSDTDPDTANDEWVSITHDVTDGVIAVGSGDINLNSTTVKIGNGATAAGILAIQEDTDDGTNNVTFTVPTLAADVDYTLPADDGDANEVLQTNGSGTLEWVAPGAASFTDIDTDYGNETVTADWIFQGAASVGGLTDYDLSVGDASDYGMVHIGDFGLGRTSYSGGSLDLGGSILLNNESALDAGNDPGIVFALVENGNTLRMAIPESGAGNASAFFRSATFAGPMTLNNNVVLCNTWSAYDSNIDCDTGGTGADVFIQDDLEVEGTIFAHETINLEGSTADGNQVIIQVGADPGADVTLTLPTATGTLATTADIGSGRKGVQIVVIDFTTSTATGDGKFYFHVDSGVGGKDLVDVHAEVITAGTTNTLDVEIYNVTDSVDMLSTTLTVDSTETGSDTAATPAVIDTSNDDVVENDLIRIDIDAVHTTPAKGLLITLGFE